MTKLDLEIPKEIKKLEIVVKTLVTSKFLGNYRSVFRGKGLEFESYREYTPEEDASLIDWKASARINKIIVKEYAEERNLDITFIFDNSSKMLFGSTDKMKSQYSTELIAAFTYAVLKSEDNISLISYNSSRQSYIPPGNSSKQFYKIAKELLNQSNYTGSFNLKDALKYAMLRVTKGSLIIIVSDFINPGEDWHQILRVMSKKYDIIGIMIRDPRDYDLPPGFKITLENPENGKKTIVDTSKIRKKYYLYANQQKEEVISSFHNANSDIALITTDKPFIEPLISLFKRRTKKWR